VTAARLQTFNALATESRRAQYAAHADAIEEIDLNPVIVHPQGQGLTVLDALITKPQFAT
jgi:hypothetical protein